MSTQPLRIAMVAPPWFEMPPRAYGGIEAVCADLANALVARGHEVTIIGAGRNGTRARFRRTYDTPQGPRLGEPIPEIVHAAAAGQILNQLDVDIVHDHSLAGPLLARGREVPTVVTVHGPVSGEPGQYYRHLGDTVGLVAISDAQRHIAADLNWCATVHNAIDATGLPFREDKQDWVLFLGRCTPDKGMHLAIDAARAAGRKIVLAAKCSEPAETAYFEAEIKPRLGPDAQWLGEVGGAQKMQLLSTARCLLFPIQWEEPFGMVMIEAMACGTPVVALRRGSVPEVVTHGVTGLVCEHPAELPDAINTVQTIDANACRDDVLTRFHPDTMAAGYERAYRRALAHPRVQHHHRAARLAQIQPTQEPLRAGSR